MEHLKDKFLDCFLLSKNCKLIRIKVGGEFVTINGKSIWHGLGAAKKALRYHCIRGHLCSVILEDMDLPSHGFVTRAKKNEIYENFLDWATETKFIEFVEYEGYC